VIAPALARVLAAALLAISASARAEAAEPSRAVKKNAPPTKAATASPIRALLPPGWRLLTEGLPESAAGAAVGPVTKTGERAVVVVSPLATPLDAAEWEDPRLKDYFARSVREASPNLSVKDVRRTGETGSAEIAIDSEAGDDPMRVRHLLFGPRSEWLVTIVAPASELNATLDHIQKAKARLERDRIVQKKLEEERTKTQAASVPLKARKL
jgi:hypothetical protein